MTETENYQLSQWDASDAIQRADFNADNAKIDAALKSAADAAAAESAAREGADDALQNSISTEVSARTSADAALGETTAALSGALEAEAAARAAADETVSAAAAAVRARMPVFGQYVGNGASISDGGLEVTLGFSVRALLLVDPAWGTSANSGGLYHFVIIAPMTSTIVTLTNTGFILYHNTTGSPRINVSGKTYYYVAFP